MKKGFIVLLAFALLVIGIGISYKLATQDSTRPSEELKETIQTETYKDTKSGVEFSLPFGYKTVDVNRNSKSLSSTNNSVVMQLEKSNPQSFVIVQHDTGLSGPAALLHQSILEYVETTIRQYYPVRYGSSYKSESLERTKVNDHDAVEHVYAYTDKDGKPNKVRLLVVIWSGDETYNIILQSSEANFESIKNDIDSVKDTFKVLETPSKE